MLFDKAMNLTHTPVCCSVFQYRIGQLYMISKHSHEQSERGEGVEVVQNEPYEDPEHGSGQFTEKRIYLNKWELYTCCSCLKIVYDSRPAVHLIFLNILL